MTTSRRCAPCASLAVLTFVLQVSACSSASDQADPADGASDAAATDAEIGLGDAGDALTTTPPRDGATDDTLRADAPLDAADGGDATAPPPYVKLPCSVTVGTGSGTLGISASTGKAGDVICVRSGTYTGGSIENLTDRTVQNDRGLVTITGVVAIGDLTKVTFSGSGDDALKYGFRLSGPAASFVIKGPNSGLTVHDFEAVGAGIFLDAGHTGLVWKGSTSELVLYKVLLDRIHLQASGQLFQSNYGSVSDLTNFSSDVEMSNIIVDDSKGQGHNVVAGAGIFNLYAHDWTITGHDTVVVGSTDDRDTGVLMFAGSGVVARLHREGGWGWLVRNFGVQLGSTRGEFRCENNVDLGTEYYGTCESRTNLTPDTLPAGKLSTIDIVVRNNVSAHKKDIKGGYTTAIGLVANLLAGTTATLTDNVGCDNVSDYGDVDSLHFFVVDGTVVKTGNKALASCAGLVDPITKKPL